MNTVISVNSPAVCCAKFMWSEIPTMSHYNTMFLKSKY